MLILQINLDILYFGLETIMILNEWKLISKTFKYIYKYKYPLPFDVDKFWKLR